MDKITEQAHTARAPRLFDRDDLALIRTYLIVAKIEAGGLAPEQQSATNAVAAVESALGILDGTLVVNASWVTLLDQQCKEWRRYAQYLRAIIDADAEMPRGEQEPRRASAISYEQAARDLDRLVFNTPHYEVPA